MTIQVQAVFGGSLRHQITMRDGSREYIRTERWDRKAATEALDLLEYVYHFKRQNIRFEVQ
jgi:hypothetical protein